MIVNQEIDQKYQYKRCLSYAINHALYNGNRR